MAVENTVVMHDAEAESIQMKRLDAAGAIINSRGWMILNRSDLLGSDGNYHKVGFTEISFCDPVTGAIKRGIVPVSELY